MDKENNHHTMTTHIIKRGSKLYLVEEINREFVRLTPLNEGETFERGIEEYLMTVNRFENGNTTRTKSNQ